MLEQDLKRAEKITRHTQRNWEESVPFPQPHADKIVKFAIDSPSKNGLQYYDLAVVTDNSVKRALYDCTLGYTHNHNANVSIDNGRGLEKNSQVLAPLVLVWLNKYKKPDQSDEMVWTDAYHEDFEMLERKGVDSSVQLKEFTSMHVGISSAYANLMAGALGYKTGFCRCLTNYYKLAHALGIDQKVELMLGIGEGNEMLKHNVNPDTNFEYGSVIKEPVKIIKI